MCESWAEGVEISIVRLERWTSHSLAQGAELSHSCSHALQMALGLCWGSPGPFGNITNTWGLFHTCVEPCRCGGLMLMGSTWPHRSCCHEGQHKELGGVVVGFAGEVSVVLVPLYLLWRSWYWGKAQHTKVRQRFYLSGVFSWVLEALDQLFGEVGWGAVGVFVVLFYLRCEWLAVPCLVSCIWLYRVTL